MCHLQSALNFSSAHHQMDWFKVPLTHMLCGFENGAFPLYMSQVIQHNNKKYIKKKRRVQ
jgi:hypothetical protein